MNDCNWIVCERTNRWVSALRLLLQQESPADGGTVRLREVRQVLELPSELARRPDSLVAIEVHRANLGDVLSWLATAERSYPRMRCIALVDRSLQMDGRKSAPGDNCLASEIGDALREAGALELAESPRRLGTVLALGRRHAVIAKQFAASAGNLSLADQIWASLPWQVT